MWIWWGEEPEPKYPLRSQRQPAETNGWLLRDWDVNGRQPSPERLRVEREISPRKPLGSWRPSFYTLLASPEEGLTSRLKRSTGSHARKTYLTTVHMLIYGTTTSICAFWTVTKWCFIACCIDDANYNCSSTIFGIKTRGKEHWKTKGNHKCY